MIALILRSARKSSASTSSYKYPMKLVFFGSSDFSISVLNVLTDSDHQVVCIVTTPPRKKGRGQKESPTVVQSWAENKSIPVLAPEKINTPEFVEKIKSLQPDCLVVASYGKMIPDAVLKIPAQQPLNVHPSLLPRYRGAAPIARQLLNGEAISGVTIARITSKLDAGEIIAQQQVKILPDDNGISLALRLAKLGGDLALKVLGEIAKNKIKLTPQDESNSSYAEKLRPEEGRIDWSQSADQINRQVQALVPWPCAYAFFNKIRIKVLEAGVGQKISEDLQPGSIVKIDPKGTLAIQTGSGILNLKTIHPESGKAMNAYQFALGRHLKAGDLFL